MEETSDGALAREYLTRAVSDIAKIMFPTGAPTDSMLHVHNSNFKTCGQFAAVSIVQGGPAPRFLEENVYNMLIDPNVAMGEPSAEKHLTTAEKQILESIAKDPSTHQDLMIEHGYNGIIDTDHISDIVGTVTVSIITRRQLFLAEFARGLELFGLMNAMKFSNHCL